MLKESLLESQFERHYTYTPPGIAVGRLTSLFDPRLIIHRGCVPAPPPPPQINRLLSSMFDHTASECIREKSVCVATWRDPGWRLSRRCKHTVYIEAQSTPRSSLQSTPVSKCIFALESERVFIFANVNAREASRKWVDWTPGAAHPEMDATDYFFLCICLLCRKLYRNCIRASNVLQHFRKCHSPLLNCRSLPHFCSCKCKMIFHSLKAAKDI
jgi:hypothetical protein